MPATLADLEHWLAEPRRRVALTTAAVVVLSAVGVYQSWDVTSSLRAFAERRMEERGGAPPGPRRTLEFELLPELCVQVAVWTAWAFVAWLAWSVARRIHARVRPGVFGLTVQVALAIGVAWGMSQGLPVLRESVEGMFGLEPPPGPGRRRIGGVTRLTRELFVYGAALGLLAAGSAYLARRREERRASELERELLGAQLQELTAKLQPHFLFNALHTVGGAVREGERDEALVVLDDLATCLRASLALGRAQEARFLDELELVERYLDLERRRFADRLAVETDVDPKVLPLRVPSLVLLPLVENAITHGVGRTTGAARVAVRARLEGTELVLEVEDDGPGFAAEAPTGAGLGLRTTEERLRLLHGTAACLERERGAWGGALARVRLPASRWEDGGAA